MTTSPRPFRVTIKEVVTRTYYVEAESPGHAVDRVRTEGLSPALHTTGELSTDAGEDPDANPDAVVAIDPDWDAERVKIVADEDTSYLFNEATTGNTFGTFYCWHRRYQLGNVNGEKALEAVEEVDDSALQVPVYMFDHGSWMLSTGAFSDPWDSGQVGVWVLTSEQLAECFGEDSEATRVKAIDAVGSLVQHITDLGSGNAWGFEITDHEGEHVDSCFGFVGDNAVDHMRDHVPDHLHAALESAWESRYE